MKEKQAEKGVKSGKVKQEEVATVAGKFSAIEETILARWKQRGIFEKTLKKDSPQGEYVFYDGPPFASGTPHYGHLLAGTIKDAIPRYKTMQGFHVPRRWGWDCHGLPVENLVEKELGLKTKKDIEDLGIDVFNKAARDSVMRFADDWRTVVPRLGRFVDMDDDYRTMDPSYTESVWWSFKELRKKGLLYEGQKPMHICPRCETTLSNFEVTQGYQDIKDISAYVKFKVHEGQEKLLANSYFLAWTTTPWTLPGNVALAINPAVEYSLVEKDGERFVLASNLVATLFNESEVTIPQKFSGKNLVGLSYEPLFPYYATDARLAHRERGWKVYGADFVTTEDGTGIVHIAPAFGEDDLMLGRQYDLPFVQHVGMDGRFVDAVKDFAGEPVKPKGRHTETDKKIIEHLKNAGTLFKDEVITHSYPHCWRCETPLLNYAASSWFVKVTDIKDKLVSENKEVTWVPEDIRDGRFGKWLEGARDWAISRTRYWGAPIPVWQCEKCKTQETIGSIAELAEKLPTRNRFLIMRHGEAENNTKAIVSSGVMDLHHLTEKGKMQVTATAQKIAGEKIDLIIASPLLRTRETAEIVRQATGLSEHEVVFDKRLVEVGGGDYNDKPLADYYAYFKSHGDRFVTRPPGEGGECHIDVRRRVMSALYDIDERHEGKTILIISHESPIWLSVAGAQGLDRHGAIALRENKNGYFFDNGEYRELVFKRLPKNEDYEVDLHRPYIDDVVFGCSCGSLMRRVPDVFDCWFESGSMPFASNRYLGESTSRFAPSASCGFPADFIAEGLDQTRGWFYSMLVLSTALFGKTPYRQVIVNGLVLAENGQKMSKRLKNYPDPMVVVGKYGADALRLYLMSSPVVHAEDLRFTERGVDEVVKKTLMRLDNVRAFYAMHAPACLPEPLGRPESEHVLDRWIFLQLSETATAISVAMEKGELDRAVRPLFQFVDDVSTWYLRRSRDRFKGDDIGDRGVALATLHYVLVEFSKLLAPFAPFYADYLYGELTGDTGKESVHLESWPTSEVLSEAEKLLVAEMADARMIVSRALEARAKANIKVRQPLSRLSVKRVQGTIGAPILSVVADEVNVKEVILDTSLPEEVVLDTTITPELKAQGDLRDLVRFVQDMRKKQGLAPKDKVVLFIETDTQGQAFVEHYSVEFKKTVGVTSFKWEKHKGGETVQIGDYSFTLQIEA
jgi:isoleucyl-tRNA synthetase